MLFNSYSFILLFLPISIIGYFILNNFKAYTAATIFLISMSLCFYAYADIYYLPLMLFSIGVNFLFCKLLNKSERTLFRKVVLIFAILFNIGLLFYYKYYNFTIQNLNSLMNTTILIKNIALPLAISFFTFQQISFIIDIYREETKDYGFLNYVLFVTYFPKLIQGPICEHAKIMPQFLSSDKRRINWEYFSRGLYLFALGLAKKVLLADVFGVAANMGFSNISGMNSVEAILVMLSYTFQIYFDFSGYCDMAMGISMMLNIELRKRQNARLF